MKFEPTIESLLAYQCPTWFRDAKFGIYVHWGIYSVPERGEWYGRNMYIQGSPEYEYHLKTYGHPSKFGYKNLIPLWKAENWDPDGLVALFKRAGARYFTPCAVHHDNFDLWKSVYHPWNAAEMGPQKDITGLWRRAALQQGLRFGVTSHLARSYSWFNVNKGADSSGPYKGVPYDGNDRRFWDFYHEAHDDTDRRHPRNPPPHWRQAWARRIKHLIGYYRPDFLYFDGGIPFQGEDRAQTGLEVMAYYYNQGLQRHGGRQECVMCIKNLPEHSLYVEGVATLDLERTRAEELLPEPWQTDTSIGPWGYHAEKPYRPVKEILHELVDIVSKNGNMLLNVPPKADGTLDQETHRILEEIGQWLDVNGVAIYGTRPWTRYGDGDVRFTRKGNILYVIALTWPGAGRPLTVAPFDGPAHPVEHVTLLGHPGPLTWSQEEGQLHITLPPTPPTDYAHVFRVWLKD